MDEADNGHKNLTPAEIKRN